MLEVDEIFSDWEEEKAQYEKLGDILKKVLVTELFNLGIKVEVSTRTKEFISIIKKIKKKRKDKEYHLSSLSDKLGVRVICNYNSELEIIDGFVKSHFKVVKTEYKKEELAFDKLGYTSNHYDLCYEKIQSTESECKGLDSLIFELQVRTLSQHAWSNIVHELSYKNDLGLSHKLKRKIYRLSSLYEIADDEFEVVNEALSDYEDTPLALLKKLEPYIYKFAKHDYDRELALSSIRLIIESLDDKCVQRIQNEVIGFIDQNESKIEDIFYDNRPRFYAIPLLTQPEVFIIWFCLTEFEYVFKEAWGEHSSLEELEQLSNLWGTKIF